MFSSLPNRCCQSPLNLLSDAKTALQRPVVAIGGIGLDNIAQIASAVLTPLQSSVSCLMQKHRGTGQRLRQVFLKTNGRWIPVAVFPGRTGFAYAVTVILRTNK